MGYTQKLIAFLILLSASQAAAGWQLTLDRMGYFGRFAIGGIFDWNEVHSVEASVGVFAIDKTDYSQVNLAYRYSRWHVEKENVIWSPMQIGVFVTRSMNESDFFKVSPEKYPSADYYDQTALRGGLEFGTSLMFLKTNIGIAYHVRVLDSGIVAIYNNANRDLQYYVSSALALRYQF